MDSKSVPEKHLNANFSHMTFCTPDPESHTYLDKRVYMKFQDPKVDFINEAKTMLKELLGDEAPTLVIQPKGSFILVEEPREKDTLETYLERILQSSSLTLSDYHRRSIGIYTKLYLMDKNFQKTIASKADKGMDLVSKWRSGEGFR